MAAELKPLAEQHDEIAKNAEMRARAVLWTGYAALLAQVRLLEWWLADAA